jgi:hypothetical protein
MRRETARLLRLLGGRSQPWAAACHDATEKVARAMAN